MRPADWSDDEVEQMITRFPEGADLGQSIRNIMSGAVALAEKKAATLMDASIGRKAVSILSDVVGDTGQSESAIECLRRVVDEHKARLARK